VPIVALLLCALRRTLLDNYAPLIHPKLIYPLTMITLMSFLLTPYLSFVVASRNDGYGGNPLERFQVFLEGFSELCKMCDFPVELIVIEWNPPSDRASLREALNWPKVGKIRILRVPLRLHQRIKNFELIPLFEMIAKNVGIRRANGDFVLATNPELLFSRELMSFLASRRLSHESFYRVNRFDVKSPIPDGGLDEQLAFCERNFTVVNLGIGSMRFQRPPTGFMAFPHHVRLLYRRTMSYAGGVMEGDGSLRRLHTNASGDFFLMQRDWWHRLRGYPEFPTHSHIDSYMCVISASAGVRQVILPNKMRIYHMEHERAMDWEKNVQTRPITDFNLFRTRAIQMLSSGAPVIYNDENWGLGEENLDEYEIRLG